MFEKPLSKDADKLLCAIYKTYLQRRKDGLSKNDSKSFGSAEYLKEKLNLKESIEDISDECMELENKDMLCCAHGGITIIDSILTDEAIVYMENRFPKGLSEVIDLVSKFVP